ncbi:hypothetical protein JB92DRAFT_3144730 [Gautieria morchelliformis]|nr:hypothetical protein JB92DRAFT_3144730 [Gautieria morchelliformis]
MDRLALELIDDIIGHVDDDDVSGSDLLACSQVCRFWLPSSQRRLFHHIEFRSFIIHEIHAQLQRLDHVLLNSPHLASYIRVLDLPDMSCYLLAACCEARGLPFPGRIAIDKPLSSLLHKVTQVQKLKIWNMPWDILPGKLRQSLCRVLELPSIAFVYIHRGQFISNDTFTNFINHARGPIGLSLTFVDTSWVPPPPFKLDKFERSRICHLTRLDMRFWDNSRFSNWLLRSFKRETKQAEDNKDKVERHRICRLTSLDMRCWDISRFVNWLLEPRFHVDASHLHTLHIHLPDIIEDDGVNGLLCAIGSSLRHLSIFLSYYESFNVNLEMLSLVHLKVRRQCLSTISKVLSTIDTSNHIHHMELRVDSLRLDRPVTVDWAAWDEVYSVLAGPHFQFLRVLYINITPSVSPRNIYDETLLQASKDMVAAQPLLATRGVKVSFREIHGDQCIFCPADLTV